MMKLRTLALLAGLVPVGAFAQVANISRTDLDNVSGTNITAGLSNASSPTYVDNSDPGRTFIAIKNGNGSPITAQFMTVQTALTVDRYGTISLANQTVTIPSNTTVLFGPFPSQRWNTPNQTVQVSLSTIVNVSESVIRVPK